MDSELSPEIVAWVLVGLTGLVFAAALGLVAWLAWKSRERRGKR